MIEPAIAPRRRTQDPIITTAAIGACVGLLIAAAFGLRELSSAQEAAAVRPVVEVAVAKRAPIRAELFYTGTVQGAQQATVNTQSGGTLKEILVEVGASVRAGDRLASLDPGALPAQLLQARADLQSAQARRSLVLGGAAGTDIAAARAQLLAAETRLEALLRPSAADIAVATAALSTAEASLTSAESSGENARAILLSAIASGCTGQISLPLPCNNFDLPLPPEVTDNVAGFLTSRAGAPSSELGTRAVAVLTANATYRNAQASAISARDAVRSAQAKLAALRNPSAADLAAQRSQVETARNALDRRLNAYTDADLQAANAAVAQATAQVAVAQGNLDRMTVVAPFDGIVAQRLVDPGVNVAPQTPIVALVAKAAEVRVSVRDQDAGVLRADAVATITVPGDTGETLQGKVRSIALAGDARSHTFEVRVLVDDPTGRLRPGTLTQVRIIATQQADALVVPSAAVYERGGALHVLVVVDGRVHERTVTVGLEDRSGRAVTSGLQAGDTVVVRGQRTLREGQAVQPAPAAPAR